MNDARIDTRAGQKRMYIDTPWEEVETTIREIATEEIAEALDSNQEFAGRIAKRVAGSVMQCLDGGEYRADEYGLRDPADPERDRYKAAFERIVEIHEKHGGNDDVDWTVEYANIAYAALNGSEDG